MLKNSLITLRAIEPEDIDFIYNIENNTDIWRVSDTFSPFSKHILKKYIESAHLNIFQTGQLRLIIEENATNTAVGTIELFDFDVFHQRAGIGVLIADDQQKRKKFATNSINLLTAYCKNTLGLNQIWCNIAESNTPSIKLFESLNFEKTGVKKKWNRTENGFEDVFFYQKLL